MRKPKSRYEKRRAAGLCTRCPARSEPGRCMCAPCAVKHSREARDRREENPPELPPTGVRCSECGEVGHKRGPRCPKLKTAA